MKKGRTINTSSSLVHFALFTFLFCILMSSCKKEEECQQTLWYQDNDEDGRGTPSVSLLNCEQPEGYVDNDIDEDDTQAYLYDRYFQEQINSIHLSETYPIKIFLPGIYDTDKNLPVLYVLDGAYYFEDVIKYIKDIEFDAIVVGIGDYTPNAPGQDYLRARDFIPGTIYEGVSDGHLRFYKFLTEEVVPYIDQNYENDPKSRTLVGHQMAGVCTNFSLLKGASENLVFHGYLSINPTTTNRYIFENLLDSLNFAPDTEPLRLFLSQVSANQKGEWFYLDLKEQAFPWLNLELYTVEDSSTVSFNPVVVEPSIKEGLKFIYGF